MLAFKRITLDSLKEINPFFQNLSIRTCDYSIGGLYMWVDYFGYEYCIYKNTLFIKGKTEDNLENIAFAYPVGGLPLKESILLLKDYCKEIACELILSAVPEKCIPNIDQHFNAEVSELKDWFDYLYDAAPQITLSGRKLNKRRNRANKFKRENPDYSCERFTSNNLNDTKEFFREYNADTTDQSPLEIYENEMVENVLENYFSFPFLGAMIKIENKIVSFAIGEVIGDTLFIHIMKGNILYDGIYEITNMEFIENIIDQHPQIKYINREEDVGDLGLRKSKMSYNPSALLRKYNVKTQ